MDKTFAVIEMLLVLLVKFCARNKAAQVVITELNNLFMQVRSWIELRAEQLEEANTFLDSPVIVSIDVSPVIASIDGECVHKALMDHGGCYSNFIGGIKVLREFYHLGLKETKDIMDSAWELGKTCGDTLYLLDSLPLKKAVEFSKAMQAIGIDVYIEFDHDNDPPLQS